MATIPDSIAAAWEEREGPVVLTTVDGNGVPNAIYATCTARYGNDRFVVANNYFAKTMANIEAGSRASILFITKTGKAFQLKGSLEYHTSGPVFDDMKKWNPEKHPGHGAVAMVVEEAYTGSEQLL
jgi:uncharacterized protein